MGTVFQAHEEALDRLVAIKVLARRLVSDEAFVKRFLAEARAVAKLNHTNIVQIHYVAQQEDILFFAMEFVEGCNLDTLLDERIYVTEREAVEWVRQAALGLQHAHQNGLIHRDIKPANLMLTNQGIVKIADFGLCKKMATETTVDLHLTDDQTVMGTAAYMSPEQAQGMLVDHRSDIYSLGATFYHLVTGRPPFEGETPVAVLLQHIQKQPLPVQRFNTAATQPVNRVIQKMLAKNPRARYQNYEELLKELDLVLLAAKAAPVGGPSPEAAQLAARKTSNAPVWIAVLMMLGLLGAITFWWYQSAHQIKPVAPPAASGVVTPTPPTPSPPTKTPLPPPSQSVTIAIEDRAQKQFLELKQKAEALVTATNFGPALKLYEGWPLEFSKTKAQPGVDAEKKRINELAQAAWKTARAAAEQFCKNKKYSEAIALYDGCLERSQGIIAITNEAQDLRRFTLQVQKAEQENATKQTVNVDRGRAEQELKYQQTVDQDDKLILVQQFERAQEDTRLAAGAAPLVKDKYAALQAEMDSLVALKKNTIARIQANPGTVITLVTTLIDSTGQSKQVDGQLARADTETLTLRQQAPGGFADFPVKWIDLTPASAAQVFKAYLDQKSADELLGYAILLLHQGYLDAAKQTFQAVVGRDSGKKIVVDKYLARLAEQERVQQEKTLRLQNELSATSLWQQIQANALKKDWPAVQRDYQKLIDQFKDTDLVKVQKHQEIEQFVTTLAEGLVPKEAVPFDLGGICNADVISSAAHPSADSFDVINQFSWATGGLLKARNLTEEGLHDDGRVVIPGVELKGAFQVRVGGSKNVILLTGPQGRQPKPVQIVLTEKERGKFSRISFLHASVSGDGMVVVTLHYDSGADQVLKLNILDWNPEARTHTAVSGEALAVVTRGFVNQNNQVNIDNKVEMYAQTFTADPQRTLQSMTLAYESSTASKTAEGSAGKFAAGIFGVCALPSMVEVPATGAATQPAAAAVAKGFAPVDISGACNADVISSAAHPATDGFSLFPHTASLSTTGLLKARNLAEEGFPDDGRVAIPSADARGMFQVKLGMKNVILLTEPTGRQPKPVQCALLEKDRGKFARLAFLHAGAWGDGVVTVTLHYDSGVDQVLKLNILDWVAAWRSHTLATAEVVAVVTRGFESQAVWPVNNAEMFAQTFAIDPQRTLQSMVFAYESHTAPKLIETGPGRFTAGIFAVSALLSAVENPATGTVVNPQPPVVTPKPPAGPTTPPKKAVRNFVSLDPSKIYNADIISSSTHNAANAFDRFGLPGYLATKGFFQKKNWKDETIPEDGKLAVPGEGSQGSFQLRKAPLKNAIILTDQKGIQSKAVSWEIATEQRRKYSQLAFLAGSVWGDGVIAVEVQYDKGDADTLKLQVLNITPTARTHAPADNQFFATAAPLVADPANPPSRAELHAQIISVDATRVVKGLNFTLESRTAPTGVKDPAEVAEKFVAGIFAISASPAEAK